MRLAVDARNLVRPRSGIARSIENAIWALHGKVDEIHLCLPDDPHADFAPLGELSRINLHVVRRPSAFGRVYWGTFDLPGMLTAIRPSVFWAPAHRLSARASAVAPSVLTVHDLVWKFAPQTMQVQRRLGDEFLTRQAVRHADQIIAVSEKTAEDLTALLPHTRAKTSVVHNIVRPLAKPQAHDSLAALGIDRKFILFVGTIEPRKNLARTIRAFLALPETLRRQFLFVIAGGSGWKDGETRHLLDARPEGLVHLNAVDEVRLATLYQHCSFLVMPSLYEGFGYPVIEAQQFGKLVLTSRHSAMAGIVGQGAVLVDPLSESQIAAGLCECMLKNGESVAESTRANALRFEEVEILPRLLEVFQRAVHKRWTHQQADHRR
ncbi:glycosyltransferase family 1 protein [Rhizobium sp. CSW-27]|uniref:glycosyltransferase family 4 protein n=1 Tax=Rhizobium sp. CSW-27 TaxID=2839985 RepID=UPI001C023342|nr:glycosyltransferase family 1 protein [Rhizobium sp. CSW-27]MBT9370032.1 glycosyltransferase family 4 protein [Rhizobium sp. CSW-27]